MVLPWKSRSRVAGLSNGCGCVVLYHTRVDAQAPPLPWCTTIPVSIGPGKKAIALQANHLSEALQIRHCFCGPHAGLAGRSFSCNSQN